MPPGWVPRVGPVTLRRVSWWGWAFPDGAASDEVGRDGAFTTSVLLDPTVTLLVAYLLTWRVDPGRGWLLVVAWLLPVLARVVAVVAGVAPDWNVTGKGAARKGLIVVGALATLAALVTEWRLGSVGSPTFRALALVVVSALAALLVTHRVGTSVDRLTGLVGPGTKVSGHVGGTLLATVIAALAVSPWGSSLLALVVGAGVALVVGRARIRSGEHTRPEVLAAWPTTAASVAMALLLCRMLA